MPSQRTTLAKAPIHPGIWSGMPKMKPQRIEKELLMTAVPDRSFVSQNFNVFCSLKLVDEALDGFQPRFHAVGGSLAAS